jgi:hypothetical protein
MIVYRPSKPKRKPKPTVQPITIPSAIVSARKPTRYPQRPIVHDPEATEEVRQFFARMGLMWKPEQK